MLTGGWFYCGDKGHRVRDCLKRSHVSRAGTEPTVLGSRVPGTPTGRSRGRGQASSSAQNTGRQEPQGQQSQGQARVFAMTHEEAATAPNVITGKVFLSDIEVHVLIDPGSTHSFISSATALCLHKKSESLGNKLAVRTQ